jgi:nucleoid DNA-binding protein
MNKRELDLQVASSLGMPQRAVSKITRAFLDEVNTALARHGHVRLDEVGELTVYVGALSGGINLKKGTFKRGESAGITKVTTDKQIQVHFRKLSTLRKMLKEHFGGSNGKR